MSERRLQVLNLGAGVQSSTLALIAAEWPESKRPDFAVFADTGWEPRGVYEWLDRLRPMLPFPVHVASAGNLRERLLAAGEEGASPTAQRYAAVPFFVRGGGMGRRQCTKEYKIYPIRNIIKRELGIPDGGRGSRAAGVAVCWLGISVDEASRMRASDVAWVENRYPLIELGMTRLDCIVWLSRRGLPAPPKSSCLGCPYHDNGYWERLRAESPAEFEDTVVVDRAIRSKGSLRGMHAEQFMHRSRVPLDKVEFAADEGQLDLFGEECEGVCGV